MIKFQYNDGGRAAAGFKGKTSDCVTRAIAIVTGMDYAKVYADINDAAKSERLPKRARGKSSARTGVYKPTSKQYILSLGYKWVPCMAIGSGCNVHLSADELPKGRLIVSVSKHLAAVIDGVLHDTDDCSRNGNRCVYGYYIKEGE